MSSPWAPPAPTASNPTSQGGSATSGRPRSAGMPKIQSQHTIDVAGLNLQEGDTTTTVAIGKDTYTIGIAPDNNCEVCQTGKKLLKLEMDTN